MSNRSDRNNYTVTDLVHEDSFRRMVNGMASPNEIKRWTRWMEASDRNRVTARKAATEIAGFDFITPELPDMEQEWSRLDKDTAGKQIKNKKNGTANRRSHFSLQWTLRIAAVLILGIFVGVSSYIYFDPGQTRNQAEKVIEEQSIKTGAGERKTIMFSNGSKIMLNSNSVITYSVGRLHNQTIKVVLEGEAYFEAKGGPAQGQPVFAVHTPDGVIRDIGTEFLVTVARDQSSVVLQEGKVEVSTPGQNKKHVTLSAQRGERLEFRKAALLSRNVVNPTFYTSWATGYMEFEKTTMKEFAGFVEKRFDVNVKIASSELSAITIEGAVYFKTLSELVRSVSDVTSVPVYQSKDRRTIFIGYKHK